MNPKRKERERAFAAARSVRGPEPTGTAPTSSTTLKRPASAYFVRTPSKRSATHAEIRFDRSQCVDKETHDVASSSSSPPPSPPHPLHSPPPTPPTPPPKTKTPQRAAAEKPEAKAVVSARTRPVRRPNLPPIDEAYFWAVLDDLAATHAASTAWWLRCIEDGTALREQVRMEAEMLRARGVEPLDRTASTTAPPTASALHPLDPLEYPEIRSGAFLPPIRIRNMVFTMAAPGRVFDLTDIARRNDKVCYYNRSIFAALRISLKNPKATVLVFSSGRVVVTGLQSIEQCHAMRDRMPEIFRRYLGLDVAFDNFGIQNIVAPVQCCYPDGRPFALDIAAFAAHNSCETSYEGDRFPGAIWKDPNTGVMFLAFKTGALVLTGAKDRETLERALRGFFYGHCVRYAAKPTAANTSSVYSNTRRRTGEDFYNSIRAVSRTSGAGAATWSGSTEAGPRGLEGSGSIEGGFWAKMNDVPTQRDDLRLWFELASHGLLGTTGEEPPADQG